MIHKKIKYSLVLIIFACLIVVNSAIATTTLNLSDTGTGITNLANTAGYETYGVDPYRTIGNLIKVALSFLGIIFLILVILSGFQWMSAGGNEEAIKKAKGRIKNATMGLVIILMAYALTYFILDILLSQTIK